MQGCCARTCKRAQIMLYLVHKQCELNYYEI